MIMDPERWYAAVASRDRRFDGWFYVGVTTTQIYCRPSCPAVTPRRSNVRFFPVAGAAHRAGFRACKRCRPDAAPGSPAWDLRGDLIGRAMRAIADGVVDRDGVAGLASQLGSSVRHLTRQLTEELGAGPLALARAQRARTARILIETTRLPFAHVAFASGFASVRQFNDTLREVFAATPTQLRAAGRSAEDHAETIVLRLPFRQPAPLDAAIGHLVTRAVPDVEAAIEGGFIRSLSLPHGGGSVALVPVAGHIRASLRLDDLRDLTAAAQRCRRLLDLDADPRAVDAHLAQDPALAPLVRAAPGLRVTSNVDAAEATLRGLLGQQVSIAGARTLTARLVRRCGRPLRRPHGPVGHQFPTPAAVAEAELDGLGIPGARARALRTLATSLAAGDIVVGAGAHRDETRRQLASITGIGPWTVEYVALRALHDPDAFPSGDLGLRRAARVLGLPDTERALLQHAERWRPWRAYAAQHLWSFATRASSRARDPRGSPAGRDA